MRLIPLAQNCHILQTEDKEVLFSYETPMAFKNRRPRTPGALQSGALPKLSHTVRNHLHT